MELNHKMVLTEVTTFGQYDLSGYTLEQMISRLQRLLRQYPDGHVEFRSGYHGDSDCYAILVPRKETDEACRARQAAEEETETRNREYRRQQFETLQKEFEPQG